MSTIWPSLAPTDAQGPKADAAFNTALPSNTGADPITSVRYGKPTGSGRVDESPRQIKGRIWPGVNDTFYNRILIDPASLDMGNLLSNQTRSIKLWNGFLSNRTLEGFQRNNDDGISVKEPVVTPYTLRPLEELTYTLSISTDGPAVIDASYVWTVNGIEYRAAISGRRVVIWPYPPSWDTPVTESLQWLTNILRSYDGSEQRRALRTKPRRSFSYAFKTAREESARMENLLWGWQNRLYALPVWTDRPKLTTAGLRGDMALALPTATYSFSAGALAILFSDVRTMEVVEIDSVQAGNLTLKRPLEANWPLGTSVFPVILGHLPNSVPMTRLTSQAVAGTVTFSTDPVTTEPYVPWTDIPLTYDGIEVLTRQPNWQGGLSNEMQYAFETLDQKTGAINWQTTEEFPRIQRSYSWLLNGRQKIHDFRAMIGRRFGQQRSFWVPSWHDDFVVTKGLGSAEVGLYVKDNEFRLMVGTDPARNTVMIRLRDGTTFFRKVVGVSSDDTNTIITLDSSLGREVSLDQFKTVHMLMRTRLATDDVNIIWRSNEVATVDTTLITVKE